MQARDFLLWSVLAALWGSSFLAIGVAVKDIDPATLVFARMAIAAPVLGCVLLLRGGGFDLGVRGWIIAAIVGVSGNVLPFLLISYAEQEVNTGLAALIMGIAPIITLVAAPLVHFEESLTRLKVFGALAGFAGVAVLAAPDLSAGRIGSLLPELCLVAAACCYAFTALFSRRFPFPDPLQMAAASVFVGLLALGGYMVLFAPDLGLSAAPVPALAAVLYLGLGPTALAALIYFYLIPRIGAARLQQVNYAVPVIGTLLGIAVLGEQPGWTAWPALGLIVFGVYLVTRPDRTGPAPARPMGEPAE
ncbi:DMT family transporter [Labrenzia sp. R4_2]|uniref:DMT family transporter n=1 Tax=Labrenzia sp. R4_2 TaxID=2821107 RepID=UPI001ADBB0EB|nr:DMT family transporter [Labrenzia sp. R4_2]MBO9418249.1 DMT family transporter [Labrenzia sp. R4_2]